MENIVLTIREKMEETLELKKEKMEQKWGEKKEQHFEKNHTIINYVDQTLETFEEMPFCELDALVFSQLSYLNLEHLVPQLRNSEVKWVELPSLYKKEAFSYMVEHTFNERSNLQLLKEVCASPRYRFVTLSFYESKRDKQVEEQFAAVTFALPTGELVVAFRGTDFTMTGWKEDFNMFFTAPVPSQVSAVAYVEEVAEKTSQNMYLVGHSKGGNLAVYSSAFSKETLHSRILSVYTLDGPGFPLDILENGHYIKDQKKVIKIVPEGSLIGVMLESSVAPRIIKSYNLGLLQHDAFSWKWDKKLKNEFVESGQFTGHIVHLDRTLNQWIEELSVEQRKTLVDTLFAVITALNVESIDQFSKIIFREQDEIWKAFRDIDPETGKCIREMMKRLVQISFQ